MHKLKLILLLMTLSMSISAQWTPETVPDPISSGSFITDPDGYLQASTISELNILIGKMTDSTGAEFAIVILKNIDEIRYDVFGFAVKLFEKRGIGKANKDNGLLLLLVMESRDWRFITGYGLEHLLTDARLRLIGEQHLLPHLRNGNPDSALIKTTEVITMAIYEGEDYFDETTSPLRNNDDFNYTWYFWSGFFWVNAFVWFLIVFIGILSILFGELKSVVKTIPKSTTITKEKENFYIHNIDFFTKPDFWNRDKKMKLFTIYILPAIIFLLLMLLFVSIPIHSQTLFIIIYIYFIFVAVQYVLNFLKMKYAEQISENEFERAHNIQRYGPSVVKAIIMPFPFAFIRKQNEKVIGNLHKFPSGCLTCKSPVRLLDAEEIQNMLDEGKKTEIKFKVSNFSVMQCKNNHIHAYRLKEKFFNYFRYCVACRNKTSKSVGITTIEAATYEKGGKTEIKFKCMYCNHEYSETHITPRLSRSSSGGGSSYKGSSSSSSSRSSSGGSSSSSRSWGGGRTGGGGAGGKW